MEIMDRKTLFISGLPRSGSTLLSNVLLQNPRIHVTASSGLIEVVRDIRNIWQNHDFFKAMPEPHRTSVRISTIQGAIEGYFKLIDRPVLFDKNRGWPSIAELLGTILGGRDKVRFIICVRDLRDVMASFEKLYRRTMETSATSQERSFPMEMKTAIGRAKLMLKSTEPVGYAINVIVDAVTRGWKNNMLFFEYSSFCKSPEVSMCKLYDFIGEEYFNHDFDNVEQVTVEDDSVHGFTNDLHKVRRKIEPQEPSWKKVFDANVLSSPYWSEIEKMRAFWRNL